MKTKAKKGFLLPPAVGYSFGVVFKLFSKNRPSFKFAIRTLLTLLINLINAPFRFYEKLIINPRFKKESIEEPPVFILGHWRSGTTHLHNLLCRDPQMGYVTTFQSVFPNTLFNKVGRFLFEGFAKLLIPGTRKGDNVVLGTELPQEEEFALGHQTALSFYFFWMFPRDIDHFYKEGIRMEGIDPQFIQAWKADYLLLIKKALKETKRKRLLSKNPPNTARIKTLLALFPEAKFIHIHRNPVEVYLSTKNFFSKMLPHLQLQTVDQKSLDEYIFSLYRNLMNDYLNQKELIPEDNLVEISFDELERSTMNSIAYIYEQLKLPGYERAQGPILDYVKKMSSYKKNRHQMDAELLNRIQKEWEFAFDKWAYQVPDHIEIKE